MQTVGVRDLANRASVLLDELEQGGQPIIVTRRGQPIAVLSAIDAEGFYDYILAHAPEFVRGRQEADVRAELERSVADPARPRDQDGVRWGLPAD